MFDRGEPVVIKDDSERKLGLNWPNHKFIKYLRKEYQALHASAGRVLKPYAWVQGIGKVFVIVVSVPFACHLNWN